MQQKENIVATYHKNCPDGTTAVAILLRKFPEAKVFPLAHDYSQDDINLVMKEVNSDTIFYTLDCILGVENALNIAKEVNTIDHHAGVFELSTKLSNDNPKYNYTFDNSKSGASLTWQYFFADESVPELVIFVEDGDLWKWEYGDKSKNINTFLYTLLDRPLKVLDLLTTDTEPISKKGSHMRAFGQSLIEQYLSYTEPIFLSIKDVEVPLYNTPFFDSKIGNIVSDKHNSVSGVFDIRGEKVRLSLRSSNKCSVTAIDIAKTLGGGGHKHAAGATITRKDFLNYLR